jgi:hypothetical protein
MTKSVKKNFFYKEVILKLKFPNKPVLKRTLPLLFILIMSLSSCIGITADITMRRDGSGKIALEYRYSAVAEAIGRLDGNERWMIIPVGRPDFERTVRRIPGLRLVSYSSREEPEKKDVVVKAELEFANSQALLAFLDPSLKRASIKDNVLSITLMDGQEKIDGDLMSLIKQVSAGYELNISFSSDGNSTMSLTGLGGRAVQPAGARTVSSGRKVSLIMDTADVIEYQGLAVHFSF